jgi:hypothetical protein
MPLSTLVLRSPSPRQLHLFGEAHERDGHFVHGVDEADLEGCGRFAGGAGAGGAGAAASAVVLVDDVAAGTGVFSELHVSSERLLLVPGCWFVGPRRESGVLVDASPRTSN